MLSQLLVLVFKAWGQTTGQASCKPWSAGRREMEKGQRGVTASRAQAAAAMEALPSGRGTEPQRTQCSVGESPRRVLVRDSKDEEGEKEELSLF